MKQYKRTVKLLKWFFEKDMDAYHMARRIIEKEGKNAGGFPTHLEKKKIPYSEMSIILFGGVAEKANYIVGMMSALSPRQLMDAYYYVEKDWPMLLNDAEESMVNEEFDVYQTNPDRVYAFYEKYAQFGNSFDESGFHYLDCYIELKQLLMEKELYEREK